MLAAVGLGFYPDLRSAAREMVSVARAFEPGPAAEEYARMYPVYRSLYPRLRPVFGRMGV